MSDHSNGPEAAYRRWGYAAEREQQRKGRAVADMFPEAMPPPELNDGDQRFTTRETDAWCRARAGVEAWDLDVAACQESHLSKNFFTKGSDGLRQPWDAKRVWCNPPFSDIGPWVEKAIAEMNRAARARREMTIAMLLPASRTEQAWWQEHIEPARDNGIRGDAGGWTLRSHFLPGRTRFGHPGNPEGVGVGSPPFGCVLLVWRRA